MRRCFVVCMALVMFACHEKKVDLSGDKPVKVSDFVKAFPLLSQAFFAADSTIHKVEHTTVIGRKVLLQFIPDSVIERMMDETMEVIVHPVGRIEKQKEVYLLATITQNEKTQLVVFLLDKKNRYIASKDLIGDRNNDGYAYSVMVNKEPTFIISKEKDNEQKQLQFTHIGWAYISGGAFTLVVSDSNEDVNKKNTIQNPIDTFSRINKYSGDYATDSKNFISVRDGKNANEYLFFIHFEKKNGSCIGELKGIMKMKDASHAIYSEGGDPCIIDFTFNGNTIQLKEKGSCGNRRGINCLFNDSFEKKKDKIKKKK